MTTQELLDYIKQELQRGLNQEQITSSLLANGWPAQDIDEAFALIRNPASKSSHAESQKEQSMSLPNAPTIFRQAWAIYQHRFATFFGIMAIPTIITSVIITLFADDEFLISDLLSSTFSSSSIGLLILLKTLFFIVLFISYTWGQIALLYAIKDSQEGIGVWEAYRRGSRKIVSYWWVSFLVLLITLGGLLLFVVPGIIFMVWFSLAIFVFVTEDLKGMNALLKSKEYVKGKWGEVCRRFLFLWVVSTAVYWVLESIFTIVNVPFRAGLNNIVFGLFLFPLIMTYSILIYSNLKAIKG